MNHDIEQSTGNLYADLGRSNAEELQSKAMLARAIYRIIKQRKLSQPVAAKLLDISQPSLCRLLQGKLGGFSTDRLLRILNQLGQDVDIKIKPITKSKRSQRLMGKTSVHTVSHIRASVPLAAKSKH